jgi:hypothetical protein
VTAARRPESWEEIWDAPLAALTEADVPPDEQDYGWLDPDIDPPAELVGLTGAELAELLADAPTQSAPPAWPLSYQSPDGPAGAGWPAGLADRDGTGGGTGFADGGELDVLPAGIALAGFADDACRRVEDLDDDCLVGVLRAWRRLASWAQARELIMVAELVRRRPADGTPPGAAPGQFPARLSEFISAEIAAALTLTSQAAQAELDLAVDLADRPAAAAALQAGRIDLPRAKIITSMLGPLPAVQAAAVEAEIMPKAADMTTGQLRAALHRAVLSVDPDAARRRRAEAEQDGRVEHWADPEGTASLTGRYLPPAAALTASKRLGQIAAGWKSQGAQGGTDLLRAHAYLALLNGQAINTPPASLMPAMPAPGSLGPDDRYPATRNSSRYGADRDSGPAGSAGSGPDGQPAPGQHGEPVPGSLDRPDAGRRQVPPGLRHPGADGLPALAGLINLTVPLTTLLGLADAPGAVAGYGPLDADTTRLLACTAAGHPATRWQITVTGPGGQALAHGTARQPASPGRGKSGGGTPGGGWTVRVTAEAIAAGHCDHRNREPGYRPSSALQRLIRARTVTCSGPGCRRPAVRCDLDHTIPYDDGGLTCECNLAPA